MNKLIFTFVMAIALCGCSNNLNITTMSEIQKMDNIVEISWWSCDRLNESKECVHYKFETGTSEKRNISMLMSAVKELKIIPQKKCEETDLICFKDKHGKILCANMNLLGDETVCGSDYEDTTGMLYKAFTEAVLAPLVSYKDYDLANFNITTMAEIQKIDNVAEITLWDCEKWKDGNECTGVAYWDSTSDKQRISEFMSVIRELKIEPNRGPMYGRLICFKDNTGKVSCTNIEPLDDKTFYGSDYWDNTGKLLKALQAAMSGCEDNSKPCPATIEDIKRIKNVVEISMCYFNDFKNGNEFRDFEKRKSTSNKEKISNIMSAIKELNKTPANDCGTHELICFKDSNGTALCMPITPCCQDITDGSDYDDNTGKFYDALQSAGFPSMKPRELNRGK